MDRPKSTVGMVFNPAAWYPDKGAAKTRPLIVRVMVQMPLEPQGRVPFTAWYEADGRLYRVEGVAAENADVPDAIYHALEAHWWRYDPAEVVLSLDDNGIGG